MITLVLAAALLQEKTPDRPLQGPAAKCGSEIPWTTAIEDAQKRARETGRPIAWWVPSLERSPMDRKLVVEKYMLAGPFMMPAVVDLLAGRFVPLRLAGTAAHRKAYGLAPLEFIEPGFLVLKYDTTEIGRLDRISTFHELWFVLVLNKILAGQGELGQIGRAHV